MAGDSWSTTTLGELCDPVRGITYGIVKVGDFIPGGVPVVRGGDIRGGRIVCDDSKRVTAGVSNQFQRTILKGGEIVLNLIADPGHSAIVPTELAGHNVSRDVAVIPLSGTSDVRFVDFFLKSKIAVDWLTARMQGSVTAKINLGTLRELPVPLPPLAEQKAIAVVLGALDDKIELNRRMNATLEAMARSLFQSWFVDFDPVRAKLDGRPPAALDPATAALFPVSFQDSELGPIPFGWTVSKLKDLTSKIGSGATPRGGSEVYVDEGPALIRSQNVYDHEFHWAGLARLTDKSASELKNVEVMKDDVLLNITGDSILRTCVVDPTVLPARVNQHVAIIRAIKGIPPRYLHFYLVQDSMKSFLIGMSAGATRHAITKGHLESTDVLKPSAQVLAAFEKLTTPWFERIDANRTQSRTLATLRDTLLPKLLSGEIYISNYVQR